MSGKLSAAGNGTLTLRGERTGTVASCAAFSVGADEFREPSSLDGA